MADVYVNSWSEFVSAIGVADDTVILPENAVWDMSDILPYGLQSNVTLACHKINGRGSKIKNLNLNGYAFAASGSDAKSFENILFTDWIGTSDWFILQSGSEWFRCAITGITSYGQIINNNYASTPTKFASCSINVESSAGLFRICENRANFNYCRVEVHAPNSNEGDLAYGNYYFCELAFYAPNATAYFDVYKFENGNLLRGNLKSIPEISRGYAEWSGFTSVYSVEAFDEDVTSPFQNYFVPCTEAQLKDAEYLRSLGFPIVVG